MPDKANELHARLVAWRKEVNAPMPTKNDRTAVGGAAKKKGMGTGKQNAECVAHKILPRAHASHPRP